MKTRIKKVVRIRVSGIVGNLSLYDGRLALRRGQKLTDAQREAFQEVTDEASYIDGAELYVDGLKHVLYRAFPRLGVTIIDTLPASIRAMQ